MGPQAGKDQNPFEDAETHPGALWFGNCRVSWKTAVCHYFHCTFSRVSTWRATSEQMLLCWGMGEAGEVGFGKVPYWPPEAPPAPPIQRIVKKLLMTLLMGGKRAGY